MPNYKVKLANGKHLVLRGDEPPTDADIEAAAQEARVTALLMRNDDEGEAPATGPSDSALDASSLGVVAGPARSMVERMGLELATSPRTRMIPGVIGTAATTAAVANDLKRGEYGRAASNAVLGGGGTALASKLSEAALRSGGGAVARTAGSTVAKALGPLGIALDVTSRVTDPEGGKNVSKSFEGRWRKNRTRDIAKEEVERRK